MTHIRDKDDPQSYNPHNEERHCDRERVCWMFRENPGMAKIVCMRNHKGCVSCLDDTRLTHTLLITDPRNGKQYTNVYDDPERKGLDQLCLDAGLADRLVYCDIECLLADGETWYMLDECGNWAYLPVWYMVEEVR